MTRFLMWTAPLLLVASPSLAREAGADAVTAPDPVAAAAKPKKVCRSSQVTGRRIATTQCYTAAQWAEYDSTNNAAANKLVSDVIGAGGKGNLRIGEHDGSLSTASMFGLGGGLPSQ